MIELDLNDIRRTILGNVMGKEAIVPEKGDDPNEIIKRNGLFDVPESDILTGKEGLDNIMAEMGDPAEKYLDGGSRVYRLGDRTFNDALESIEISKGFNTDNFKKAYMRSLREFFIDRNYDTQDIEVTKCFVSMLNIRGWKGFVHGVMLTEPPIVEPSKGFSKRAFHIDYNDNADMKGYALGVITAVLKSDNLHISPDEVPTTKMGYEEMVRGYQLKHIKGLDSCGRMTDKKMKENPFAYQNHQLGVKMFLASEGLLTTVSYQLAAKPIVIDGFSDAYLGKIEEAPSFGMLKYDHQMMISGSLRPENRDFNYDLGLSLGKKAMEQKANMNREN